MDLLQIFTEKRDANEARSVIWEILEYSVPRAGSFHANKPRNGNAMRRLWLLPESAEADTVILCAKS